MSCTMPLMLWWSAGDVWDVVSSVSPIVRCRSAAASCPACVVLLSVASVAARKCRDHVNVVVINCCSVLLVRCFVCQHLRHLTLSLNPLY